MIKNIKLKIKRFLRKKHKIMNREEIIFYQYINNVDIYNNFNYCLFNNKIQDLYNWKI